MLYPPLILTRINHGGEIRVNPTAVEWYCSDILGNGMPVTRVRAGDITFSVTETPEQIAAMTAELCRLQNQTVFNIPGMGLAELRAIRSVGRVETVERSGGDEPDHGL